MRYQQKTKCLRINFLVQMFWPNGLSTAWL